MIKTGPGCLPQEAPMLGAALGNGSLSQVLLGGWLLHLIMGTVYTYVHVHIRMDGACTCKEGASRINQSINTPRESITHI